VKVDSDNFSDSFADPLGKILIDRLSDLSPFSTQRDGKGIESRFLQIRSLDGGVQTSELD
jgi:hypothetical protein